MRNFVAFTLTVCALFHGQELISNAQELIADDTDPYIQTATALRCGSEPASVASECVRALHKDFETGIRKPEEVVRRHCTRFDNSWSDEVQRTSDLCSGLAAGLIES
jgi:hypothetical protein